MTKKSLSACLFVATLLATTASFAKSDEAYFYPKNKWKVEQVGSNSGGALKTCSLSNQFNNGYIIQIAGNADGFTNLNIDFRQNSFEKNLEYEVQYSIPGIMKKTIPTKAFKENLLVSDLRGEKDFSSAMQAASVLDIKIRGVGFRMYMTGFNVAMKHYSDCVAPPAIEVMASIEEEIIPSIISDSTLLAPPPPMIQEMQEAPVFEQNIEAMPANKLRPDPSKRQRYTEQLAQQLKEESKKYKPSISEPESELINDVEPEASAKIITEKAPLKKTNFKSPKPVINITKVKTKAIDLTQIEMDKDKDKDNNIPENSSLEMASTQSTDMIAETLSNIEPATGQNDNDFVDMRNKVSSLEGQIGVLLNKNEMLNEELKIVLQDSKQEQVSVSSSNWDLERATIKFNEAERQVMRLGRKLQTYKAQCQQEKTELETMLFDPSLTSQNQLASLASLEEELDTAKSDFYRQQRQYEERIRLLENRLETAQ